MKRMELFPLFFVSSELNYGMQAVLSTIVELMPNAFEMEELHAFKGAEGDATVEIHATDTLSPVAHVFKTMSEPHVGDVTFFRLFSGAINNGDELYNATRSGVEKLNHLSIAQGKERIEIPALHAGDIGCVAKLRNTHTNDTLSTRQHPVRLPLIAFPEGTIQMAVHAANRADEEKLQAGLHRLHDEDPTFEVHYNAETHETIVSGLGERHLEVGMSKLKRKFGVTAELSKPKIAYRETIKGKAEGQGRHKKQSGGRGQFGDCWVRFAPLPRGSGYQFVDEIVGGSIPRQYIPAVDRGIQEAAVRGILAGYPAGRLPGRGVRRLVPHRRLERNVVQDGGHSRVQGGGGEVQAGAARAARRVGDRDARRLHGRRARRPVVAARAHSRYGAGRRRHEDSRRRAAGGATRLRECDVVDDAGSRDVQAAVQGLRGSAARDAAEDHRGVGEGERRGAGDSALTGGPGTAKGERGGLSGAPFLFGS